VAEARLPLLAGAEHDRWRIFPADVDELVASDLTLDEVEFFLDERDPS
jgi:hypothetical protein